MIYQRTAPTVASSSGRFQQHLYFDDMTDFPDLPTLTQAAAGSDAYCVTTQDVYILSGNDVWEVQ